MTEVLLLKMHGEEPETVIIPTGDVTKGSIEDYLEYLSLTEEKAKVRCNHDMFFIIPGLLNS